MPSAHPVFAPNPAPAGASYFISHEAARRRATATQRRAAANALVDRQLGGQSIESSWTDALARTGARRPSSAAGAAAPQKPASAQTADDSWREIMSKQTFVSAFVECRR